MRVRSLVDQVRKITDLVCCLTFSWSEEANGVVKQKGEGKKFRSELNNLNLRDLKVDALYSISDCQGAGNQDWRGIRAEVPVDKGTILDFRDSGNRQVLHGARHSLEASHAVGLAARDILKRHGIR